MMDLFLSSNIAGGVWLSLKLGLATILEKLFDLTLAIGIPNYALAIIIFTLVIKLVLFPLSIKQLRSMRQMQNLQPKIKELEAKYGKQNTQKKQEETMKLYKENNVNPMSGCLPLLIQMPILFALFQVLRDFVPANPQYYKLWWLGNLSNPDPTWALAIIVAAASFFMQYVSTTNKNDTMQKTMLYMMPIMFGWMARSFPAGLSIYWTFFSLFGVVQQLVINQMMKKEEAAAKAKEEAKGEKQEKDSAFLIEMSTEKVVDGAGKKERSAADGSKSKPINKTQKKKKK